MSRIQATTIPQHLRLTTKLCSSRKPCLANREILQIIYINCEDFTLRPMTSASWKCFLDSVIGHSQNQIYSFLTNLSNGILGEVRNEATADEILQMIKTLPWKEAVTDRCEGARFIWSFSRATNAAPSKPKVAPMLTNAWPRWSCGTDGTFGQEEPILMAGFLQSLGNLKDNRIEEEQIRQLRQLVHNASTDHERNHITIVLS